MGGIVHRGAPGGQSAASIGQQGPTEGDRDGLSPLCCATHRPTKTAVTRRSIGSNYGRNYFIQVSPPYNF